MSKPIKRILSILPILSLIGCSTSSSSEEETKHIFNAYASKNSKKYYINSYLSIKGEYAIIDFRFSTTK